jgi:hypothetical protein
VITLGRLITIGTAILLTCLIFLFLDVRHRMTGYKSVNSGIMGTATIAECEQHRFGSRCTGTFTSADGSVKRSGVRVVGAAELLDWNQGQGPAAPDAPAVVPAAIADQWADEAWTTEGAPWLRFSLFSALALAPLALLVLFAWAFTRAGTYDWWMRLDHARGTRTRGVQRRENLRMGRTRRQVK